MGKTKKNLVFYSLNAFLHKRILFCELKTEQILKTFHLSSTLNTCGDKVEIYLLFYIKLYLKSWFPKPLTSTPTCYSFADQVTTKKSIFTKNLLQMENVDTNITNWNLE